MSLKLMGIVCLLLAAWPVLAAGGMLLTRADLPPLAVVQLRITVEMTEVVARTKVTQVFHNTSDRQRRT